MADALAPGLSGRVLRCHPGMHFNFSCPCRDCTRWVTNKRCTGRGGRSPASPSQSLPCPVRGGAQGRGDMGRHAGRCRCQPATRHMHGMVACEGKLRWSQRQWYACLFLGSLHSFHHTPVLLGHPGVFLPTQGTRPQLRLFLPLPPPHSHHTVTPPPPQPSHHPQPANARRSPYVHNCIIWDRPVLWRARGVRVGLGW